MSVQVEPEDFQNCPNCGEPMLLVAYWDEDRGKVGEVFVVSTFEYHFSRRDYKRRLVVDDYGLAMGANHNSKCPKLQSGGEEVEEEPKPYQGPRSKR